MEQGLIFLAFLDIYIYIKQQYVITYILLHHVINIMYIYIISKENDLVILHKNFQLSLYILLTRNHMPN